ncbi:hypothetical protein DV092_06605 [Clostridium botulinum]|nr:hypothetical protein [Clostridium botulinum]
MNLSFTACSFYFKKPNTKGIKDIYNLNDMIECQISEERCISISTKELLINFFKNCSKKFDEKEEYQKTFYCEYNDNDIKEFDNYICIYSIIHSGNYGSSSEIRDRETRDLKYTKTPNEADERPFYIYIVIPKDNEEVKVQKGIIFIQNIGPYGIKTITTDYMREYLKKEYNIQLKINTVAPQLFVEKVLKRDSIKKIIMINNHMSSDSTDNINYGYGVETRTLSKIKFNDTVWDKVMNGIKHCLKGKSNYFEFENARYPNLKVVVNIGDRERTVDVHNIDNLSIIESIPDEVKDQNGWPNKEKLLTYFEKVTKEYLVKMVLQIK